MKKFNINESICIQITDEGWDWVEDETEAYVFDRKSHAKAICKGMKLDGLSIIEKP